MAFHHLLTVNDDQQLTPHTGNQNAKAANQKSGEQQGNNSEENGN